MGKLTDILDGKIEEEIIARYSEYGFESAGSNYLVKSDDRDKLLEAYKLAQYSLQPLSFEDAKKQLRILYSVQARLEKEYQSRKRHIKWLCYWLMYQQICWFML